jgi:hypothetical protein
LAVKLRGEERATEDITSNGACARLGQLGGNASSILPEHIHCIINCFSSYMDQFEKSNYKKDWSYRFAEPNTTGFCDYLNAASMKFRVIIGFAGGCRARQDFVKCMIEDFHLFEPHGFWVVKNLVRKCTRVHEGRVVRESPALFLEAGVFKGALACLKLLLRGRNPSWPTGTTGGVGRKAMPASGSRFYLKPVATAVFSNSGLVEGRRHRC